jgi:outer membrane receptor for ferric coprogen and ferric-rhodotorulic acid
MRWRGSAWAGPASRTRLTGYAFTETEYLRTDPATSGRVFMPRTPRHSLNLWSQYDVTAGPLKGLIIGGGVKVSGAFYSESAGVRLHENGYTLVNLQVGYRFDERRSITLTVDNLFDEKYYEKLGGLTCCNIYGDPRSATVTLRGSF